MTNDNTDTDETELTPDDDPEEPDPELDPDHVCEHGVPGCEGLPADADLGPPLPVLEIRVVGVDPADLDETDQTWFADKISDLFTDAGFPVAGMGLAVAPDPEIVEVDDE